MITLPSARKRAEEFAAAVDHPSTARPELAELVGVVDSLRAVEAPSPRPDFTAALRERLVVAAAETLTQDAAQERRLTLPARPTGRRERRLAAAATALVLAGGSAGMAAASQQALPGEVLYPIKRGIEDARADLASGDAAKGRTLLDQADGRLAETRSLLDESAPTPVVGGTIETFRSQAGTGSQLLLDDYRRSGDESTVADVRAFARDGLVQLDELSGMVPEALRGQVDEAAVALRDIDLRAAAACPTCVPPEGLAAVPASFRPAADAARILASLDGTRLNNDHPLVSERQTRLTVKAEDDRDRPADGGSPSKGPATPAAGAEEPDGGPGPGGLTGPLEDLAMDLGGVEATNPDVTGPARNPGKTASKGGKAAQEEVDDVAKRVPDEVRDRTDPLLDPLLP